MSSLYLVKLKKLNPILRLGGGFYILLTNGPAGSVRGTGRGYRRLADRAFLHHAFPGEGLVQHVC